MKTSIVRVITIIISMIFVLVSIFTPSIVGNSNQENFEDNYIDIININENIIEIKIELNKYDFSTMTLGTNEYIGINLYNIGISDIQGQAKLPVIRKMIEIPQDSNISLNISSVKWKERSLEELNLPLTIEPLQPFKNKNNNNSIISIDEEYYNQNLYMPDELINDINIAQIRGRRFALIEINPVKYNPVQQSIKLMESCEIEVKLKNSNIQKTIENIERYSSVDFEEMYNHIFSNYGYYENMANIGKEDIGYLIIVHDDFLDEITPLANWKTTMGYTTTVTLTSEIPGGVTADNIKSYIENAYDTWSPAPSYILLVGDTPQIPAHTGPASYGETDSLFVRMDGDIFADIYIGRFPAATGAQVDAMVDKTIYYEQGNFPSNDWIKKAAFIASDDMGQMAEDTHNYVIDTHLEPNGYVCDTIYEASGGNTEDISDAVNDGRSLCIYSGHGGTTNWVCVPFYQSDVNDLTNNGMYPFVVSHACITGSYELAECFGETWVRVEDKGAIAFWGSSINTQWDPDDIIERRVFDAWWNLNLDRIGQMTDKGMYDAYNEYGSGMEDFIESYNIMGDASIKIWKDDTFEQQLFFNPDEHNFGNMNAGTTDYVNFEIWNGGGETLEYTLSESCDWLDVSPVTGESTGEHDTITVEINTNELAPGGYQYDISIESNGGDNFFSVFVNVINADWQLDQSQEVYEVSYRVFGDQMLAQSFVPDLDRLTNVELFVETVGSPSGDLHLEVRVGSASGSVVSSASVSSGDVGADLGWIVFDVADVDVTVGSDYFLVLYTDGGGISDCYGWAYIRSNLYADGSMWTSRNGVSFREYGGYDFCFRTFGN